MQSLHLEKIALLLSLQPVHIKVSRIPYKRSACSTPFGSITLKFVGKVTARYFMVTVAVAALLGAVNLVWFPVRGYTLPVVVVQLTNDAG
jgi:hypothetical protein